jgi:membrane-associated phospholipid phosphatase
VSSSAARGLALAALVASLPLATASAEELEFRPFRDGGITIGAGLFWLANQLYLETKLGPDGCRWCDRDGTLEQLNDLDGGVRARLRWDDTGRAATLSDLGAYMIAPAAAFGLTAAVAGLDDAFGPNYLTDAGLILEASFVVASVTQVVKLAAARERPFVHVLTPEEREALGPVREHNLSYFSGHTSFAFSLASASGAVASLRGYRHAWAVWAVGMTTAAATGYLRIAADKHYASDVISGAAIGALLGAGLPHWLGRRRADQVDLSLTAAGATVGVRGRF